MPILLYIQQSVKIEEWWPNGYGKQVLYDLYVFFEASDGEMSTKKIRMGFRTVELVQDYVSANKSLGMLAICTHTQPAKYVSLAKLDKQFYGHVTKLYPHNSFEMTKQKE